MIACGREPVGARAVFTALSRPSMQPRLGRKNKLNVEAAAYLYIDLFVYRYVITSSLLASDTTPLLAQALLLLPLGSRCTPYPLAISCRRG